MERRNEVHPNFAIQKRIEVKEHKKCRDQINQQRDNMIPDTFGLEDGTNKHEVKDKKNHELRDNILNRNLTNHSFLVKSKIVSNRKIVEAIMPFKENEAFEK